MSRLTLEIVAALFGLSGQEVVSVPEDFIVGTLSYDVLIDRQCSGYEGIGLIAVLLGFYLFLFRKSLRFPNALTLPSHWGGASLARKQPANRSPD